MIIFVMIELALVGSIVWGVLASRKDRHVDRRHYATFVGFIAGAIAVTTVTLHVIIVTVQGHMSPYEMGMPQQIFEVVAGWLTLISIALAFVAGLFSRGIRRIVLIGSTLLISFILLLTIVGHFGD